MSRKNDFSILIIEDNEAALFGYKNFLSKSGYTADSSTNMNDAEELLRSRSYDLLLLDLKLEDGNSLDWIPRIKTSYPEMPVIVITGIDDTSTAVTAIKNGAEDFLTKPVDMDMLASSINKSLEFTKLRRRDTFNKRMQKSQAPYFGSSPTAVNMIEYARVAADNDSVILIQGETGTGKGMLAKWIHENSLRKDEQFINLNCSTLRGDLLRSELYGHAKGAFTSAVKNREGLLEAADGGTLFLDEIGDMDIEVQARILKTLEERTFRRIGENKTRKSNFRLICATNQQLMDAAKEGRFREDLYYRICIFPVTVPPLRERSEDICGYAEYFLREFGYQHLPLEEDIINTLENYSWPGNIRELRNMMERAMLLSRGGRLKMSHFPGLRNNIDIDDNTDTCTLDELEQKHILKILEKCGGDKSEASRILGISTSSLYRRLSKFEDRPV